MVLAGTKSRSAHPCWRRLAPMLARGFAQVHAGTGSKFTPAVCLGLTSADLAEQIGLAPIVGAFAAGLALDPVHLVDFDGPPYVRDLRTRFAPADVNKRAETTAKALGVMDDRLFSAIVVVLILTRLLTAPVLASLLRERWQLETEPQVSATPLPRLETIAHPIQSG